MSRSNRCLALFACCLSVAAVREAQAEGLALNWRQSLDAAKVEASQTGRLVLVHFWSPNCGPCRVLEQSVFNQPQVVTGLEKNFVPVKVNAETAPALVSAYRIRSVPTDVILTPQGNLVTVLGCPNQPGTYLDQLQNISAHYQQSSAAALAGNVPPTVNTAYAGLDASRYAAPSNLSSASANPASAAPQAQVNPYMQAVTDAAVAEPPPGAPAVGQAQARYAPPAGEASPASVAVTPPSAASAVEAAARGGTATAATGVQGSAPSPKPQLPAGAAPLAFDGYCPVSLKSENRWVPGDVRHGVQHRGRTYLFAASERLQEFMASPDAYSPVFNGMDPVLMLDENRPVEGSRKYGFKHRGAFYLFSSSETMKRFEENPDAYAAGVRQAMARLDGGAAGGVIRR